MMVSTMLRGGALFGGLALLGVGCPQLQQTPQAPLAPPPQAAPAVTAPSPVAPATEVPGSAPIGSPAAPAAPAEQGAQAEISMGAARFTPTQVTVRPGTTVTFRNDDTKPHWPASEPHPIHTGLPGFDALGPVAPGGMYAFTFVSPGTFGFHDHLSPGVRGTVVVE